MAIIISFFNHKGRVGKTTLTYNLAWALMQKSQKVLMIDADSQCNLSEFCVGMDKMEEMAKNHQHLTIYDLFLPIVNPREVTKKNRNFYTIDSRGLDLIAGDIRFAEFDYDISLGINGVSRVLEGIPQDTQKTLQKIGENYDYILIDLPPSLSSTNQLLLMLSDYFITPVFPSIFSLQALNNLSTIFRKWVRSFSNFNDSSSKLPQLLGMVFQNFRPYGEQEAETKAALRFKEFHNQLNDAINSLAKDLNGFGMAITTDEFIDLFDSKSPYTIAEISDFNQLKLIAETEHLPVIALDNKILNKNKLSTPQYIGKRDIFASVMNGIATGLIKLKDV